MLFKNFAFSTLLFISFFNLGVAEGATISGTMNFGGQPAPECWVAFRDPGGFFIEGTGCDPSGNWASPDLPPGTYYVTAHGESWGFVSELYDGIACPWEVCEVTDGLAIVLAESDVSGIAFDLEPEERIYQLSGSVLDTDGNAVSGAVRLYNVHGGHLQDLWIDHETGFFQSEPLASGTFYAATVYTDGVLDEAWANESCVNQMCDLLTDAMPIFVPSEGNDSLHFVLESIPVDTGGHIGGQVLGPDGPLSNVGIELRNARGDGLFWVGTDAEGRYQTHLLANDSYFVVAHNDQFGLRSEVWNDVPCVEEWHCWNPGFITAHGTEIVLSGADELDIDFHLVLPPGGLISGQLVDADTGLPVMGGGMALIDVNAGHGVRNTGAGGDGMYYFSGLAPGNYKVLAEWPPEGYTPELYGGDHCPWPCDPAELGDVIVIENDTTVASGADIYLDFEGTRIVGQITRSDTGEPVNGHDGWIGVELHRANGEHLGGWGANEAGLYEIRPEGPGDYYLVATNDMERHHLMNEVWEDIPCVDECYPLAVEGADLVSLAEGETIVASFGLDPGYRISGTLNFGAEPAWDGWVNLWNASGEHVAGMGHDGMGNWMSPVLPQGAYYATAHGEFFGFVSELFDNRTCPWEACDVTAGDPIELLDGDVEGILFELEPELKDFEISGWIRDMRDQPVGGMVRLFNVLGWHVQDLWTHEAGRFRSQPLANGTYYAVTMHTDRMLDEAWKDVPCVNQMCDPMTDGTPIVVAGGDVTDLNFVLEPITAGGHIGGQVRGPDGPVAHTWVEIRNANGEHLTGATTDASGYYRTVRLAADNYYVIAQNERLGLGRMIWDDVACSEDWQCWENWFIRDHGTLVGLWNGDRPAIDFDLVVPPGGRISGQLIDAETGLPVMGGWMALIDSEVGHPVRGVGAGGDGMYHFSGLAPGRYKILAEGPPAGYTPELYGGEHCFWPCDPAGIGAEIVIESDTTVATGKNIHLDFEGTRIAGRVTRGDTGEPVDGSAGWVGLDLFSETGDWLPGSQVNEAGLYSILLDEPGPHYLAVFNDMNQHHLMNEVWHDKPCFHDCNPMAGDLITLVWGETFVADFELTAMERELPVIEHRARIHPSARIGDGSVIEENVVIHAFAYLGPDVHVTKNAQVGAFCEIGPGVYIGQNSVLGPGCFVGDNTHIDKGVWLGEASSVGHGAIIGKDVRIGDFAEIRDSVELGKSVRVASGVCIEHGTVIAKDSVIDTGNCH
ncbi:MAG: hypothetical protein HKO85_11200 [Xanthomonadales bacterium]|nr:hypothetical protein [Gammaproteobacteria bacterium]NNL05844.1 hypothetical protein [Xanthomonadales bacterium]